MTLVYISRFTHFGRKSNKAALPQPLLSGPRPGCHQAGRMAGMAFELTRLKMPELLWVVESARKRSLLISCSHVCAWCSLNQKKMFFFTKHKRPTDLNGKLSRHILFRHAGCHIDLFLLISFGK